MSNEQRRARLDELFRVRAAAEAEITVHLGESDRNQAYRDEGATSTESWVVERFGVSTATARALTRVGEKAWDMPHLIGALCSGDVSLDKVRAVADVATPEMDEELKDQAQRCTVRELADVARTIAQIEASRGSTASSSSSSSEHDRRFFRFNDTSRTMTAQLPRDTYAEVRTTLEALACEVPTDGETPWDQRVCDGFTGMVRTSNSGGSVPGVAGSPHFVVVHVPLDSLVDDAVDPTELAGELEHDGLIDRETVQRMACDATIAVAIDDDVGHTMYEGRARRSPTDAQRREVMRRDRHCRFPGCTYVTFTNVHHIAPWEPGGKTDLENLALLCLHHHHVVHSNGWTMTGSANEELHIVGPSGRRMTSRPSPLWTRATALRRFAESDRGRSAAAPP